MSTTKKDWLKGTFPGWIRTALMGFAVFVGARYLDFASKNFEQVQASKQAIAVIVEKQVAMEAAFVKMEKNQERVLVALELINKTLVSR